METPEHIAKYRVLRLLGQGAMGRVFLAEDPMIDRKVAIKVMSVGGDEEARERFRQEARTVGQLSHPNIVHLYDFGFHEGAPYLVMEYLDGESLDHWLLHDPPLDARLAALLDLCRATTHAHQRGVLHRDVKPSNLQVLGDGSAKLLDFGIARSQSVGLTATGTVLGTPQFMAPEVLRDAGYSARSDVYAVGLVVYEALSGSNPFRADTLEGCLTRVLTHEPPDLAALVPYVPADFSELVGTYLRKDPNERPADLGPMEAALRRLRERVVSGDLAARMTATLRLPAEPPARPSRRPLAAVAAVVALVALVLLAVWGPWRTEPVPPPAGPPSSELPATTEETPQIQPEAVPPIPETTTTRQPAASPRKPTAEKATSVAPPKKPDVPPAKTAETKEEAEPADPPAGRDPEPGADAEPTAEVKEEPRALPPAPPPVTTSTPPPVTTSTPPPAEPVPSIPAPRIDDVSPTTVRRGSSTPLKITGSGLGTGCKVVVRHGTQDVEGIRIRFQGESETEIQVTLHVNPQVPFGTYSVVVIGADGQESGPVYLEVSL